MAPRPELAMPVEARGMLRLDPPVGRPLELIAEGGRLRVELPSFREARRAFPPTVGVRGRALRSVGSVLSAYGLTVSLESAGRPVLQLGCDAPPNWLAYLLGLAPCRVPFSSIRWILGRDESRE